MFKIKQITMVGILGLALVLATAVYTQSAFANTNNGGNTGNNAGNGVHPGGSTTGGQNSQGQDDNSQGNGASGGATGGAVGHHGPCSVEPCPP